MVLITLCPSGNIGLLVELSHLFVHSEMMVSAFCARSGGVQGREGRYPHELGLGPHAGGVQKLEGDHE